MLAVPAKRGRPAKAKKTPPPQTSTQQTVPPVYNAPIDLAQPANETEQENIALRKKIAEMEGKTITTPPTNRNTNRICMLARMKSKDGADTIRAILKPNGEAGDKRNGFVLQDAMELSGTFEEHQTYLAILVSVLNRDLCCHTHPWFPTALHPSKYTSHQPRYFS